MNSLLKKLDPVIEKLAEGIRKFYADARKLEQYARARVNQKVAV